MRGVSEYALVLVVRACAPQNRAFLAPLREARPGSARDWATLVEFVRGYKARAHSDRHKGAQDGGAFSGKPDIIDAWKRLSVRYTREKRRLWILHGRCRIAGSNSCDRWRGLTIRTLVRRCRWTHSSREPQATADAHLGLRNPLPTGTDRDRKIQRRDDCVACQAGA